tara:strand:+ start:88 stop:348 length:261 start_codon:yes stop_codon:yes gene_type:complete
VVVVLVVVKIMVILEDQEVEVKLLQMQDVVTLVVLIPQKVIWEVIEVWVLEEVAVVELAVLVLLLILIHKLVQPVVMVDQVFQMQF